MRVTQSGDQPNPTTFPPAHKLCDRPLPIGSDRRREARDEPTSARAWLNNSTNARAANTCVPAAGNVCRDAYNSGDTRVGPGGDNIGHIRF